MIKFTNLERCYNELKDQLIPAYEEINQSGKHIDGKYCDLACNELKKITGRKHALLYPSGTSAILGSLLAWDIYDKKVALPNYSYVASANQAAMINGVEFFDVDENGLIDLKDKIKQRELQHCALEEVRELQCVLKENNDKNSYCNRWY